MSEIVADILLVDDDEPSRYVKSRVLRGIGWNVTEAGDGKTALRLTEERPFDLVVLDVKLPDMSGLEVCRRIKEYAPDLMVLQTSATFVSWKDRVVGFDQGADGYLVEPVEDAELVAQIRALLRIKMAERRQAEAEALLAHALEASSVGAWDWDLSTNRCSVSPGLWQLLGLTQHSPGEGVPWREHVLPQDLSAVDAAIAEAIDKRQMLDVEFRIRRPDGEVRWLASRGRVLTERDEPRMVGVALDITDRKRAEEHAALLAAIVAQSPDAIISYDLEHRITTWNSGAEALFGYTVDEVLGKTALETIVLREPEHVREAELILKRVGAGCSVSVETRRRRKDGTVIDVAVTAAPIRDRHGRTVGKSAIIRDITERKHAERALFAARQRMQAVLEAVPVGISFSDDPSCQRVTGNSAMLRLFEVEAGANLSASAPDPDAPGRRIRYFRDGRELSPEELPLHMAVNENHIVEPMELEVELPSGRRWCSEDSGAPIRGPDDEVIGGVAVTVDITERRRAEQHINLLMAETNHRAKNLLSVVQGIARLTAPEADPAVFADRLSQRLRALAINQDLLVQTNWHGIEFRDLVRSQLEPFQELIGSRVSIAGPDVRVSAAAAQAIGMALHELATNASKYGALSQTKGKLRVSWDLEGSGPKRRFCISWRESEGPLVRGASRKGFGHTVIVQMVERALEADVQLSYKKQGVVWEVIAPADRVLESSSAFVHPGEGV